MGLFQRQQAYDRRRILEAASRARTRGRHRRAISLYRRVLAVEPQSPELHARLAPLLARTGQHFDAWASFRVAGRALLRDKKPEQALVLYRDAARLLPRQIEAWQNVAKLEQRLGRERDAFETLQVARRHFRRRSLRPQAIALLRRAREIEPWNPECVLDLAWLLVGNDQQSEAEMLLEQQAERCEGRALRRVRAAQLRLSPTLVHAWQWMRAVTRRGEEPTASLARSFASGR